MQAAGPTRTVPAVRTATVQLVAGFLTKHVFAFSQIVDAASLFPLTATSCLRLRRNLTFYVLPLLVTFLLVCFMSFRLWLCLLLADGFGVKMEGGEYGIFGGERERKCGGKSRGILGRAMGAVGKGLAGGGMETDKRQGRKVRRQG